MPVASPFPPQISGTEEFLVAGSFTLATFEAPGDGTYTHDSSFFFATGALGLAATAGFAAVRAAGNAVRRSQAAADAVPRWLPAHNGTLTVSDEGV